MPINPFAMISYAQRSQVLRWFFGLRNFSLAPTRPGEDPVRRLQLRMITTLSGVLALLLIIIAAAAAGIALAIKSPRPAGWILLVGGAVTLLLTGRALIQSLRNKMPAPGVVMVTIVLDLAAVAAGVWMLAR